MAKFRLGKTELMVEKQGFGCLPIQRCTKEEAAALLRRAVDGGMNYFDSARGYSDRRRKSAMLCMMFGTGSTWPPSPTPRPGKS